MKQFCTTLLAMLIIGSVHAQSSTFDFDKSHTEIYFKISHLGYSTTIGRFDTFEGSLSFDEQNPANSSVEVTIPVSSINMNHKPKEDHMQKDDFFDSANHPNITFASSSVTVVDDSTLAVNGDLTIRGTSLPVTLDVTINKVGKHPFKDDYVAGFTANTTIKRSDYGVSAYLPLVGDEVKITISTETVRKAD